MSTALRRRGEITEDGRLIAGLPASPSCRVLELEKAFC